MVGGGGRRVATTSDLISRSCGARSYVIVCAHILACLFFLWPTLFDYRLCSEDPSVAYEKCLEHSWRGIFLGETACPPDPAPVLEPVLTPLFPVVCMVIEPLINNMELIASPPSLKTTGRIGRTKRVGFASRTPSAGVVGFQRRAFCTRIYGMIIRLE